MFCNYLSAVVHKGGPHHWRQTVGGGRAGAYFGDQEVLVVDGFVRQKNKIFIGCGI